MGDDFNDDDDGGTRAPNCNRGPFDTAATRRETIRRERTSTLTALPFAHHTLQRTHLAPRVDHTRNQHLSKRNPQQTTGPFAALDPNNATLRTSADAFADGGSTPTSHRLSLHPKKSWPLMAPQCWPLAEATAPASSQTVACTHAMILI